MGVIWPGTIHSGPAASTIASIANPFPIGLECCKYTQKLKNQQKPITEQNHPSKNMHTKKI